MNNETITGSAYRIIQAAIPEAEKRELDLDLYRISVHENNTTVDGVRNHLWTVSFIDRDAPGGPPRRPGNPGKMPGLEVLLDRNTLQVVRAGSMA